MEEIVFKDLDTLFLDKNNPRIFSDIFSNISQLELAEVIYDQFGISDLVDSILKNGYFSVEPMVVVKSNEGYTVVEGNRRLTTIKILCYDEYRNKIIPTGKREQYTASEELKKSLQKIPVVEKNDRDSVISYLGVRHLGGVMKWEPLAQSKYVYSEIYKEYENDKNSGLKSAFESFVRKTSKKRSEVLNFFCKYKIYLEILEAIENDKSLKDVKIESKFSLLEVSLV